MMKKVMRNHQVPFPEGQGLIFLHAGETLDYLLECRICIIQKNNGYRFSLDALLLAHFIRLRKDDKVIEFGTGSAVIPLILQNRYLCKKMIGMEIQKELAETASRSVKLNAMEDRIEILHADVRQIKKYFPPESFNVVFFNPPYRKRLSGRVNPNSEKAVARHELSGSCADFVAAAKYLLKANGIVFCIYPASRLVELICRFRENSIEPKRLRMVHTDRQSRAEFILLEGVKRAGEELNVMPPLYIYDDTCRYTDEMKDLFKVLSVDPTSCGV
jgi:tRNA1Val (adenine37-N6)-methyltransferase